MPGKPQAAPPASAAEPAEPAGTPLKFQPVRSARAFEEIAAQIRTELAEGRLAVGSRLPAERALAAQFGVSRNTLREALRSLEHAGLVRLQKGSSGGAFISEGSGDALIGNMLDLYRMGSISADQLSEARIWLESIVVREACLRATSDDMAALRQNIEEMARASGTGDFKHRAELNLEFHRMLARITGNPFIVIMMDGLLAVLRHYIETIGEYENAFVLPSRRRFMKHMEEGNPEAAVAEMETSLKRLQRAYLSRVAADAGPAPKPRAAAKRRAPAAKKKPGA